MNQPQDDSQVKDPNLGRELAGNYRIDALLGEGGMGSVYRGVQLSINRPVAIKLIAGHVARREEHVHRFRREAVAMGQLGHPNTVRLFDFGETGDGELYMVMELLQGCDLSSHLLARGSLPLTEALSIIRAVMQALAEAHALSIVHRDLKPANVFLASLGSGEQFIKVMDFGVASLGHDPDLSQLTTPGAAIGTPAYMSPEQAMGQTVDARADLYAAGIMLFEMLTGRPPFEADTMFSLLTAHVTQPPPRLQEVRPDMASASDLQELLDRMLAKEPAARPASALEVRSRVDELLGTYGDSSMIRGSDQLSVPLSDQSFANTAPQHSSELQLGLGQTPNVWSKTPPLSHTNTGDSRRPKWLWVGAAAGVSAAALAWGLQSRQLDGSLPPIKDDVVQDEGTQGDVTTPDPKGDVASVDTKTSPETPSSPPETVVDKGGSSDQDKSDSPAAGDSGQGEGKAPQTGAQDKPEQLALAKDTSKDDSDTGKGRHRNRPERPEGRRGNRVRVATRPTTGRISSPVPDLPKPPAIVPPTRPEAVPAPTPTSGDQLQASLPPTDLNRPPVVLPSEIPAPPSTLGGRQVVRREPAAPAPTTEAAKPEPSAGTSAQSKRPSDVVEANRAMLSSSNARERRAALLRRGSEFTCLASAKRAFDAGRINKTQYEDNVFVLEHRRDSLIKLERQRLEKGEIDVDEYHKRAASITKRFAGK